MTAVHATVKVVRYARPPWDTEIAAFAPDQIVEVRNPDTGEVVGWDLMKFVYP